MGEANVMFCDTRWYEDHALQFELSQFEVLMNCFYQLPLKSNYYYKCFASEIVFSVS
jgi:hypothetical protein